jgi:bilin biosynthesis protein
MVAMLLVHFEERSMLRTLLSSAMVFLVASISQCELPRPTGADIDRLVKQLGSDKFSERQKAREQLDAIGEPALESLRKASASGDAEARRLASGLVKRIQGRVTCQALIQSLKDPDEKVQVSAREALVGLGSAAVPSLIEALQGEDKHLQASASRVLGQMGIMGQRHAEAIPVLLKRLKEKDGEVRFWSADALSHIVVQKVDSPDRLANRYKELVPALLAALAEKDEKIRVHVHAAVVALDKDAVPGLIKLMEGKDNELHVRAANVLAQMGTMGRRHKDAIPVLTRALRDENRAVRQAAAHALSQIVVDE